MILTTIIRRRPARAAVGLTGWNQASITIPGLQILTVVGSLVSVIPIAIVFVFLRASGAPGARPAACAAERV